MKGSGIATMRGKCIKGEMKVDYALTTHYGDPSIRISWRDNELVKYKQVHYFDFKEGDNYGTYKYKGSSTKSMALLDEPGYAEKITINPERGEISFDFNFQNFGSFEKTDNYFIMTSKYCSIYISR
ncbi:MAG: hypothetical protein KIS94_07810 [Chitinophagales bacterium]|nr:hypothetical protein [Chitinophagales bacterium]